MNRLVECRSSTTESSLRGGLDEVPWIGVWVGVVFRLGRGMVLRGYIFPHNQNIKSNIIPSFDLLQFMLSPHP